MFTDPIADYLTRVRNAQMAGKKVVEIPASNMKKSITEILFDKGYILNYKFEDTTNNQGNIKVALKYNNNTNMPAILSENFFMTNSSNCHKYLLSEEGRDRVAKVHFQMIQQVEAENKV